MSLFQVYKSTADYTSGKELYDNYSAVNDDTDDKLLSLRQIVMERKMPRRMFVQVNTVLDGGENVLGLDQGFPKWGRGVPTPRGVTGPLEGVAKVYLY